MNVRAQPELPIDPPAEVEIDSDLTALIDKGHNYRQHLQSIGVELAEVDLLTPREDRLWESTFGVFEWMLGKAEGRVAQVTADRRKAEADG